MSEWWRQLSSAGKIAALVPVALAIAFIIVAVRQVTLQPSAISEPQNIDEVRPLGAVTTRASSSIMQNAPPPAPPAGFAGAPVPAGAPAREATVTNAAAPPVFNSHTLQRPQLIRTGAMSLLVPDVEHAVAQLTMLAQSQFGDVVSLDDQTPSTPGIRHTAQVQLSVPAERFDQTMAALAQFGAVQSRSINAENVSDQIVDAQARLRNLRRTEADMLRILDRSGKIPDVLDVTQQIAQVREQIEQLDAQLQSMQHQVAYSTISVSIEDEKPVAAAEPSFGSQLGDAWRASLRDLRNVSLRLASIVLVLVAFAPYWLAIALVALFVANRLRRR